MRISRYIDGTIPHGIKGEKLSERREKYGDHYLQPDIEVQEIDESVEIGEGKTMCERFGDGDMDLGIMDWFKRNKMNIALGLAIYGGYRIATRRS